MSIETPTWVKQLFTMPEHRVQYDCYLPVDTFHDLTLFVQGIVVMAIVTFVLLWFLLAVTTPKKKPKPDRRAAPLSLS